MITVASTVKCRLKHVDRGADKIVSIEIYTDVFMINLYDQIYFINTSSAMFLLYLTVILTHIS